MIRSIIIAGACLALAACGEKKVDAASVSATPQAVSAAAAQTGGAARIVLSGSLPLNHDSGVKNCSQKAPGHTLLSGYSVSFAKDAVLESGGIHVPAYKGDGTYQVDVHPHSFAEDPMQLSLNASAKLPHGATLSQQKSSTLTVTISNGGKNGSASLKKWSTLYPDGGMDSGTITWSCPS